MKLPYLPSPGELFKKTRKKLGLSQYKLSKLLGISRDRVRDYETERSRMYAVDYIAAYKLINKIVQQYEDSCPVLGAPASPTEPKKKPRKP